MDETDSNAHKSRSMYDLAINIPKKVIKDFAKVRKQVMKAVKASPKSVTLEQAMKQIKEFEKAGRKDEANRKKKK
jgi:hypothetical protein